MDFETVVVGFLGVNCYLVPVPREDALYIIDPGASAAEIARSHGIPVFTTEQINDPEWVDRLRFFEPDVLFSFYYRHMLKKPIREIPKHGCVNLHGSPLPKYRGRCPVNWQVLHGETESAATLHYIVARADAGGTALEDERLEKIHQSLSLLADRNAGSDRSEQLLNLFTELE
jgi:UDP-4-amino-4-deoxy-L-arabinose formyltransferase/UDP-glucuronic acid dehydrogenase (UDP-4-keto-hexauronic acid decarboxylating)